MNTSPLAFIVGLGALVLLPACPLLDIEAQVADTCATYHDVQVPALPPATPTISQQFTFDQLQSIDQLANLDGTMTFTRAIAHATSGISDFSFVNDASLTIASGDPSSTLPSVVVFACTDCGTPTPTLDVATGTPIDAKAYVASGSLVVTVDLSGQAPTVDWTMDVDVCMAAYVSYTYAP